MIFQFDKLYEVEILHNYYPTGISEDFHIEPTASCKRLLQNYGLIFRRTSRGFAVFYETSDASLENTRPTRPIGEDVQFSFILLSKNPYLLNYSDLPLDGQADDVYYLHNLNNSQQQGPLLLSSDGSKGHVTEQDRIRLRPQFFYYTTASVHSSATVEILDETDHSLKKEKIRIAEGVLHYPVDLHSHHPGRYKLKIDGKTAMVFYANSEVIGQNIFGIIDLYHNNLVPASYRFINENNAVEEKTYTVKIKRRQTYWKYYVALKYHSDAAEGLSITYAPNDTSHGSINFERQSELVLSDGTTAVPFVSNVALPIQEAPINNIRLERTTNGFEIANLPNPSVTMITPSRLDDRMFSEMFVYI